MAQSGHLVPINSWSSDVSPEHSAAEELSQAQLVEPLVPSGNEEYLRSTVIPLLHDALEELGGILVQERLQLATGELWDEDGYRPETWAPVDPLQYLTDFFRLRNPKAPIKARTAKGGLTSSPSVWLKRQSPLWHALSKEDKLEACFRHLDYDESGLLDEKEVLALYRVFDPYGTKKSFSGIFGQLEAGFRVSLQEYKDSMMELTMDMPDEDFDNLCQQVLGAVHLTYLTRQEKLKLAFEHLDLDGNGELDMQELQIFAKSLNPRDDEASTSRKANRSLAFLDTNQSGMARPQCSLSVSLEDFTRNLLKITANLDDDTFDNGIQRLLDGDKAKRAKPPPPGPEDSLQPKFRQFVLGIPLFRAVRQMTAAHLQQLTQTARSPHEVLILDVRSAEEQAVSLIPNARLVPTVYAGEEDNDVERAVLAANVSVQGCKAVVVYCATGQRSCIAAQLIRDSVQGVHVSSLCGGAIAWFNEGKPMVDGQGKPVQALHPGSRRVLGYITEPNAFHLPKRSGDVTRDSQIQGSNASGGGGGGGGRGAGSSSAGGHAPEGGTKPGPASRTQR